MPLIQAQVDSEKLLRLFGLGGLFSTVELTALEQHGDHRKNHGDDLHLGMVCGHDLGSNWPS